MLTGGGLGSDAAFFKCWKRVSLSSSSMMDNILLIFLPMLRIFCSRASRLHQLGWRAVKLLGLVDKLGVSEDKVSSVRGGS